jgi:hypothetical protein
MNQLASDIENTMTKSAEQVKLIGILIGDELAEGLASRDPVVRAQAEGTRDLIEERLAELGPIGEWAGKETGQSIKEGLKSKDETVRSQTQRTKDIIEGKLKEIPPVAATQGGKIGDELGENIHKNVLSWLISVVALVIRKIAEARRASGLGQGALPKSSQNKPGPRAAGGPVSAFTPYVVGEQGPELFVPQASGVIVPNHELGAAAGSSGDTFNTTILAPTRAMSAVELAEQTARVKRIHAA